MKFFAIDVQLPETTEFLKATDAQIAEWLRLHALCAKQVNGGRIEAVKSLPAKFWERHGINPATPSDPSPLWRLEADALVLVHFDHEGQRIFLQKSKGGKARAEQMWGNGKDRTPISSPRNTHDRNADSPVPSQPVPSQSIPNESFALNGASSGLPSKKSKAKGTLEELKSFAVKIGMPAEDGEDCFDRWEGNGWKNDGKPIADWQATMRTWKRRGFLASQNGSTTRRGLRASNATI